MSDDKKYVFNTQFNISVNLGNGKGRIVENNSNSQNSKKKWKNKHKRNFFKKKIPPKTPHNTNQFLTEENNLNEIPSNIGGFGSMIGLIRTHSFDMEDYQNEVQDKSKETKLYLHEARVQNDPHELLSIIEKLGDKLSKAEKHLELLKTGNVKIIDKHEKDNDENEDTV